MYKNSHNFIISSIFNAAMAKRITEALSRLSNSSFRIGKVSPSSLKISVSRDRRHLAASRDFSFRFSLFLWYKIERIKLKYPFFIVRYFFKSIIDWNIFSVFGCIWKFFNRPLMENSFNSPMEKLWNFHLNLNCTFVRHICEFYMVIVMWTQIEDQWLSTSFFWNRRNNKLKITFIKLYILNQRGT